MEAEAGTDGRSHDQVLGAGRAETDPSSHLRGQDLPPPPCISDCGAGRGHDVFPRTKQTTRVCIWLLTGAVHVSGWGPCWTRRDWQNRDHQGPGQSPGLALCGNQLRRRHGLQSKAVAPFPVPSRQTEREGGHRRKAFSPCTAMPWRGDSRGRGRKPCATAASGLAGSTLSAAGGVVSWTSVPSRGR